MVYDDLDLPLGRIRLRVNGSSGGHHGMESIINTLGGRIFRDLTHRHRTPLTRVKISGTCLEIFRTTNRVFSTMY